MKKRISLKKEKNLIEFFNNNVNEKLAKSSYVLKNEDKKFILETDIKIIETANFRFENLDNKVLLLDEFTSIKILSSHIKSSSRINSSYSIHKFSSENFDDSEEMLYRLIIPCDEKIDIRYYDFFSNFDFMISVNTSIFGGIEFSIENYTLCMYDIENFFVVECSNKISLELFDKYCRICLTAFGFVTGSVPMDKGYYFGYEDFALDFKQFLFSSTFYSTYKGRSLLTTNPYEFYQNHKLDFKYTEDGGFEKDAKISSLEKELKPLEKKHFEKLIDFMLKNDKFGEVIFSVLSINNLKSLPIFLKGGLYAIVLEMITAIISSEQKEQYEPEQILKEENAELKEKLQIKLRNTAKEFFEEQGLSFTDSIVEKRLNGIYTPINSEKLTMPYDWLEIALSEQDIKNIKTRNKFLHGSNPYNDKDLEKLSKKLLYINLKLNYLINAMIYKYIGYDGILKNLAKIYLDYENLNELEKENYYRKL